VVFSSPSFLFFFLPLFLVTYYLARSGVRNAIILAASILFYFAGAGYAALVLVLSVPFNQYVGRYIAARRDSRKAKLALAVGIAVNLLPLLLLKYLGFFGHTLMDGLALFGIKSTMDLPDWLLPAGISFFTFQGMSYLIDIYWGSIKPAERLVDFGMYLTSFPQLIAGPIVRYAEIEDRVVHRPVRLEQIEWGIVRFCFGLAKKIIIADNMGAIADKIFALSPNQLTASLAWLGAFAYTLQIYFDFSGYSDMAIGMGNMMGFRFPENFNQPYRSQSVTEFWRRWHMTLSRWFRDYLYIPLGGNRAGPLRTYFNLVIVFFLCGLWHGAAYTFIVWGLFHGLLLVIERILRNRFGFKPSGLPGWALTLFFVIVAWVFFRSDTVSGAIRYLAAMFGFGRATEEVFTVGFYLTPDKMLFLVVGTLISLFPLERFQAHAGEWMASRRHAVQLFALLCFVYSAAQIAANGFNPFIYFRF
jgi:alginate O-acetyltransferase complex protein AlgI